MFFSKCLPRKIAKFCGLKANFHTCFNIFPNMHQIALQSIQSPSKLRATPFDFKSHGIHGQIFSFGRNWSHKSLDPPLTSSLALKVFLLFSFYVVTIFIVCMNVLAQKCCGIYSNYLKFNLIVCNVFFFRSLRL